MRGAKCVKAVTTHGLFPGDSIKKLKASGLLEAIVCTDSHPSALQAAELSEGFLDIRTVTPILAAALNRGKGARL